MCTLFFIRNSNFESQAECSYIFGQFFKISASYVLNLILILPHDDPTRVGFENQNVRTWVGLVFETAYISGSILSKGGFKVNVCGKLKNSTELG